MFGGMQVLAQYHRKLDPAFVKWYLENFRSTKMGYLHWPVECTDVDDGHYTDVVGVQAGKVRVWENFSVDETPTDATFDRNTNSFALALAGFAGAGTSDLGPNCASPEEVDGYIDEIVKILLNHRIPVSNVESHGEAADNVDQHPGGALYPERWQAYQCPVDSSPDGAPYGPLTTWERWDLEVWILPETRKLYAPKADHPEGCIRLPDFIRGEVLLKIQEATKPYWQASHGEDR